VRQITSLNNDRVRRAQALLRSARRRSREGLVVVEGLRLLREAMLARCAIQELFFTANFRDDSRGMALFEDLEPLCASVWEVSPQILAALSDTETPQGITAVLPVPTPDERFPDGLTLVLDQIRDPGNLGTILRSAWAAGVRRVLLPPGTVDPLNPKVVRSGMGAHFHLPIYHMMWDEAVKVLGDGPVWLAEASGSTAYDAVAWSDAVALIVGGEAAGAGEEGRALASGHHVAIPMASGVESLNAAVAASILLFEAARQRRQ